MSEQIFKGGCSNCGYGVPGGLPAGEPCPFCHADPDEPEDPEAERIRQLNERFRATSKARNLPLEEAVRSLRDKVDEELKRLDDRGPVVRDVVTARILRANPELAQAIETAAADDPMYKARAAASGPSVVRMGIEHEVRKLAEEVRARRPELTEQQARAEVWKSRPDLVADYHRPGVEAPGIASVAAYTKAADRKGTDEAIRELGNVLAPGDRELGLRMVAKRFPKLYQRWQRSL